MGAQLYFDNYSPVGDLLVVAMSFVILVLLSTSYVNKTKVYGVYVNIVVCLFLAAITDVFHHNLFAQITDGDYRVIYVLRIVYHAILFSNLFLYVIYTIEVMRLERNKKVPIVTVAAVLYLAVIAADVITDALGKGFRINEYGRSVTGINVYFYGYLLFVGLIIAVLVIFRKRIYKRIMMGFYGTIAISFLVLYLQGKHGNVSFTVGSFLLPTVTMLYLIHANPYDIEIGSINAKALEDMVSHNYKKGIDMILMSLYLPEFDVDGRTFTRDLQDAIRRFASEFFREGVLFQISNGHMVLVAKKKKNQGHQQKMKGMIEAFYVEYDKFRYNYKIVMGEAIDEISRKNEYVRFIKSIHQHMEMNEVHVIKDKDVEEFEEYEFLLAELSDICQKGDLRDKRVLAYCQPVYNLKTKKYDTAEALMRLNLPGKGIIYPDQFIPIAEENGFIHGLTKIILQKTCDEIEKLIREGYEVNRVSVNVSITEWHDAGFTDDIFEIIRSSAVPDEKIAIEITESQTEQDFVVVKKKISELKERGIKFYLDDFGTGYSNVERILELPFDIIKFDRSLVNATEDNARSEKMVGSLANMFSELNYSVLYEGVETDGDERRCADMYATYLQGYKYSRPVPIAELRNFFSKLAQ